ncbi:hypothetical protein BDF19DRAFT_93678 [Syncephalis fuscata]|nr:hypothetical protein BDF19DRAFT_93678 [Syncephalis fuscata]
MTSTNNNSTILLWGFIHLDPRGEQSVWDFLLEHTSLEDARNRAHSNFIQTVFNTVFMTIFFRNSWRAFKLIRHRTKSVANWCCFLQAVMGIIMALNAISSIFPGGSRCRINVWVSSFGMAVSSACVSVCLLTKAYAVQKKSRLILIIGILLIIPQLGILWIAWVMTSAQNSVQAACTAHFPSFAPWYRFVLDIAINILFSIIFLRVVIRQYKALGSKCWKKLKRDGLFYLIGVVFSNMICAIITASSIFGPIGEMMFLLDWMLTSVLLIRQHEGIREAFQPSNTLNLPGYKYKRQSSYPKIVIANN